MQGSVRMKFDSIATEAIYYGWKVDDECGSQYGMGWAGLYLRMTNTDEVSAVVLHFVPGVGMVREVPDEGVSYEDLWMSLINRYELSGEPGDDDIVISHEGPNEFVVTPLGLRCEFKLDAIEAVLEDLYYGPDPESPPPIWFCNRRGCFTLLTEEELMRWVP